MGPIGEPVQVRHVHTSLYFMERPVACPAGRSNQHAYELACHTNAATDRVDTLCRDTTRNVDGGQSTTRIRLIPEPALSTATDSGRNATPSPHRTIARISDDSPITGPATEETDGPRPLTRPGGAGQVPASATGVWSPGWSNCVRCSSA
jgi:hypothetical protein